MSNIFHKYLVKFDEFLIDYKRKRKARRLIKEGDLSKCNFKVYEWELFSRLFQEKLKVHNLYEDPLEQGYEYYGYYTSDMNGACREFLKFMAKYREAYLELSYLPYMIWEYSQIHNDMKDPQYVIWYRDFWREIEGVEYLNDQWRLTDEVLEIFKYICEQYAQKNSRERIQDKDFWVKKNHIHVVDMGVEIQIHCEDRPWLYRDFEAEEKAYQEYLKKERESKQ